MAILSLVVYLLVSLGISIPGGYKTAGRFPCEDSPCGCKTPEACWKHCCCTTFEERLAWAIKEHVVPPDFVKQEVLRQGLWNRFRCLWEGGCEALAEGQSETGEHSPRKRACCCAHKADAAQVTSLRSQGGEAASRPKTKSIVLISAMKCQGQTATWLGVPVSVAAPPIVQLDHLPSIGWVAEFTVAIPTISHRPPTRPPLACASV